MSVLPRRLALAVCLVVGPVALAQPPRTPSPLQPGPQNPTLNPIPLTGATRGHTVELTLTGTNLSGPTGLGLTFPAQVTFPTDANNGKDNSKLRVRLTIPADAPVGLHLLRLATTAGLSNARPFCVDDLPTVMATTNHHSKATAQSVPVPCAIVGQAAPQASDFYKVKVSAGQRLSIEALGRRLGSPFDPFLRLYDGAGRELPGAFVDDTPGLQSDARLSVTFATAGDYLIEVRDSTYRGGPNDFYRLRIGDFPCATSPWPLAVKRGSKSKVGFAGPQVDGVAAVEVAAPADPAIPAVSLVPRRPSGQSGWPVTLLLSDHDELTEKEPNDTPAQAQRLPVPGGVSGRFDRRGDIDHYYFQATRGRGYVITAHTREFSSPAVVLLVVRDTTGKELGRSDPKQPVAQVTMGPTTEGDCRVSVENLTGGSGPSEVYHLTIDTTVQKSLGLDVVLAVDRVDVAPGRTGWLPVQAVTRRGVVESVELTAIGPPGLSGSVTLSGSAKPIPNVLAGLLPVRAKPNLKPGAYEIRIVAKAKFQGQPLTEAVDTTDLLRPALSGLPVVPRALTGRIGVAVTAPPFTLSAALAVPEIVRGMPATLTVRAQRAAGFTDAIALTALPLPPNVTAALKPIPKGANEVQVTVTAAPKAAAPLTFPLVLTGKAKSGGRDFVQPAPVTVAVSKDGPIRLTVAPGHLPLKAGGKAKVKVTIVRQGGYRGPVTVELKNLPVKVTAAKATIAAKQTSVEVELTAAADAPPAEKTNVSATGTATAAGNQTASVPLTVKVFKK